MQFSLKRLLIGFIFLAPPILVYIYFVRQLDFVQDDAYISYRYVANFLNGDGLVFNIGERVEGISNIGWTIYLVLIGAFKADFIAISQITGTIFGAGIIIITFLTARLVFKPEDKWFAFLPPYLLGANMALAYWAQSGLETAAFAFFASLAFYLFLIRSRWLILALTLAVWIRPEGALIAFLLIIIEAIFEKRIPKYALTCAAISLVLSLPFVLFKYFYYGSIIPNPFYAKTGWTLDQFMAGIDYSAQFLKHYGFFGAGIIITAVFWKNLSKQMRAIIIFVVFYVIYIVLIGGDVLKVHRFFLPIFGLAAILLTYSLWLLVRRLHYKNRFLILFLATFPLTIWTYQRPKETVWNYRERELGLVISMQQLAKDIKSTDSINFSAALTTIGAFSYELVGHTVIDMLGLTDTMIARRPEPPIKEFETTWREQNFNATYVLTREPDYIVFSTGVKPSAPAEQALLLYPQFVSCYTALVWYQSNSEMIGGGKLGTAFKKVREIQEEILPKYPPEYVRQYKIGCELSNTDQYEKSIKLFDSAIAISQKPYLTELLFQKALSYRKLKQRDSTRVLLELMLRQDSMSLNGHRHFYILGVESGDSVMAHFHKNWIQKLAPWYWPRLEFEVQMAIAKSKVE